jgi:hypothetical protein
MTVLERFLAKVEPGPNGCLLWTAALSNSGYGSFFVGKRQGKDISVPAHRWYYEFIKGPIPEGLDLDHFYCQTRSCVNPEHLEPVTERENVLRSGSPTAINARKKHCPKGHPYDLINTYFDVKNERHCRACRAKRAKDLRQGRAG